MMMIDFIFQEKEKKNEGNIHTSALVFDIIAKVVGR